MSIQSPIQKFRGCIFDLDGVIVDTAKYHFQSWNRLAHNLGFEITEDQNEQLKGISRRDSLEIVLKIGNYSLSEKEKIKCMKSKNEIYLDFIDTLKMGDALPGVRTFLSELKEKDYKIAMGSASKNAKTIISKLELTDYFDVLMDGNDVINSKPHPEVFLKGLSALNLAADQVIVFEDAQKGIEAAKKAGCHVIGIGDKKSLAKADFVMSGFKKFTLDKLNTMISA